MLNNLGNVSLYLISIANIVRFLGFPLYLVCFVHRNNVFLVFLFVLDAETVFLVTFCLFLVLKTSCLMSFVCLRDEDDVSSCF